MNNHPNLWGHLPNKSNISRVVLPNGITILSKPDYLSPSVIISGYLNGGSMLDPDDQLGLALFTSYALMRGTRNLSSRQIYQRLEACGASLGFGASVQSTSFGGKALVEDFPLLLDIMSEALFHPTFPQTQVQRLKMQMLAGLQLREQSTSEMASIRFDQLLFPNHAYGKPEDGNIETIQNIQRRHLIEFHQKYYQPKGMVIVIAGALDNEQAVDLIFSRFGEWQNLQAQTIHELSPVLEIPEAHSEHIPLEEKIQLDLIMGCQGPARTSPDYLPALIGNNILGQFGMMGRIGEAVREKSGLAYYSSTSLNAMLAGGSWEISAGIHPANYDAALAIILREITRFLSDEVSDEELIDARSSMIGSIPLSVESNYGVASAILKMERFNLGLDYLMNLPAAIEKIDSKQILRTAQKYLDLTKLIRVSAGPALSD